MQIARKIYYSLSPKMRFKARRIFYFPIDIWEGITGKRNKYEPPKGHIYIGSGDFIKHGVTQFELLKKHIELKPTDSVLDVGSGIGRTAVALTKYLNTDGKYEGFDVIEKGVKWCTKKINKDFPNFNFKYIPLNNDLYNNFKGKAEEFKFPYEDNSFDKVFLFSVFTHMLTTEIAHYLCEIKRVLKPNGLCFATFFIYNDENEVLISKENNMAFTVNKDRYKLMNGKVKSANIALKEDLLDEFIIKSKLKKVNIIEGFWKDNITKNQVNEFQDIMILKA